MTTIYNDGGAAVQALLRGMILDAGPAILDENPLVRAIARVLDVPSRMSSPPAGGPKHQDGTLTARERSVLHLIGEGLSNKRIARDLNIAPETVKSHTKHIFGKLGTQTRAQSVAHAVKLGLI